MKVAVMDAISKPITTPAESLKKERIPLKINLIKKAEDKPRKIEIIKEQIHHFFDLLI